MSMVPFDKLPPHNLEAEFSVIGSALIDNGTLDDTADILLPEDFYRDTHQFLFRSILEIYRSGQPVDAVTLIDYLHARNSFDRAGGDQAIREALEKCPSAANAKYYAQIVKQLSIFRQVIDAANLTLRDAYSRNCNADELLEQFEKRAYAISDARNQSDAKPIESLVSDVMREFDLMSLEGSGGGLMTGFIGVDRMIGGFKSRLYVLGARPGQGKTAWGLNVADHVASQGGQPVLFFSLEMDYRELTHRFLSGRAGVDGKKFQTPVFANDADRRRIQEAVTLTQGVPLWVDASPTITATQIAASSRRFKSQEGLGLIIIDYVQLIRPDNRNEPRQEQIAGVSRRLQALAKEIDTPILALAQLNRESEKREDKRPRMADLRECIAGDQLVFDAATGSTKRVDECVSSPTLVYGLRESAVSQVESAIASPFWSTGIKPVFRLLTKSGRSLRCTANHPLRTIDGWRRLDEIAIGERIAVPRSLPVSAPSEARLASIGVLWDEIVSVEPDGECETFDTRVEGIHNFVVNGIFAHNSGQLEQDAHGIMLLHRPEYYDPNDRPGIAELIIAKNRSGAVGTVDLTFEREYTRFSSLSNRRDDDAIRAIDNQY